VNDPLIYTPTVLIADDEQTMRSLLGDLLRQEGCRVIAKAANGIEAYELYTSKSQTLFFWISICQKRMALRH